MALLAGAAFLVAGPAPAEQRAQTCEGEKATIVGKDGTDNTLKGTSGDDVIAARVLLGDGGTDKLFGKDGDDAMQGGKNGNDLCHGGPGDDLALKSNCERIQSADGV